MLVFQGFPADGVVALYDEPNTTGDPTDINAPRNLPALDPEGNLALVHFHSDLDYLEIAQEATVSFAHAAIAAASGPSGTVSGSAFAWAGTVADNLLLDISALGLSTVPFVLVAAGGNILWPGMAVQTDTGGRARYCSVYATTTEVRIWESASKSGSTLAAATIDYKVLVFKDPPASPLNDYLMDFDPSDGGFEMGFGKFNSSRKYLQIAVSSPLGLSYGRNIDLKNGAARAVRPDGTAYDPVPSTLTATVSPGTGAAGPSMAYNGTFIASGIQVEAP